MNTHFSRLTVGFLGRSALVMAVACSGLVVAGTGCGRTMTITQADYINTGMQIARAKDQRTGQPLEVNIVSVYPHDLNNELNSLLSPDQDITADLWYLNRPQYGDKVEDDDQTHIRLPKNQVFLLTDDKQYYGTRIGSRLRGAVTDKRKKIAAKFEFAGSLHDKRSVIYVFPKFIGPKGEVLPVPPVKLHPPGAFTHELFVEIGVEEGRENYGQYIDNKTERKMHGKDD